MTIQRTTTIEYPVITETRYNDKGQVDEIENAYLYNAPPLSSIHTKFAYDVLGRVIEELAPGETNDPNGLGGTDSFYLDPGTVPNITPTITYQSGVEVRNDKLQIAGQYFDAQGRLIAAVDAAGVATRYGYLCSCQPRAA